MEKQVKLTIVIPHFNSPQFLRNLLQTIPDQDEIQIVVVDDRSTKQVDEYWKLREEYKKRGVEFYENDSTKSAGTCRNIGMSHAQGDWLLFADADDFFLEGFYDIVSTYFESDYDIVFFPPTSVYAGTDQLSDRHIEIAKKVYDYLEVSDWKNILELKYCYSSPCSKLIRRSLIQKNHITFDEILASNDVMFSMKTGYCAEKITADANIIYCITMNAGSLTNRTGEEVFDARIDVFFRRFEYLKERLSGEELKYLEINGRVQFFRVLQNGYGLKKAWKLLKKYKEYGVPFWGWDMVLNGAHFFKVIIDQLRIRKRDKDYVVK